MISFLLIFLAFRWDNTHAQSPKQACPNGCNSNGYCTSPGRVCKCFQGYTGADCSLKTCPQGLAWTDQAIGIDDAHNLAECSRNGICNRINGVCTCRIGYEGTACELLSCPNDCSGAGKCQTMHYYALAKDPGLGTVFDYSAIWDAHKIRGCNCDTGRSAPDCSHLDCPTGDDPLTGNVLTATSGNPVQYNEVQVVSCKADGGWFTISYMGQTTAPLQFNARVAAITTALGALTTIGGTQNIIVTMVQKSLQACSNAGKFVRPTAFSFLHFNSWVSTPVYFFPCAILYQIYVSWGTNPGWHQGNIGQFNFYNSSVRYPW